MNTLYWVILGICLILCEPVVPGFCVCFFGAGALVVALFNMLFGLSLLWQLLLFLASSLILVALLFKYVRRSFSGNKSVSTMIDNEYVGKIVHVTVAINPPDTGRVMVGDAEWKAAASETIEAGTLVRIVRQDNLTFHVERENKQQVNNQ